MAAAAASGGGGGGGFPGGQPHFAGFPAFGETSDAAAILGDEGGEAAAGQPGAPGQSPYFAQYMAAAAAAAAGGGAAGAPGQPAFFPPYLANAGDPSQPGQPGQNGQPPSFFPPFMAAPGGNGFPGYPGFRMPGIPEVPGMPGMPGLPGMHGMPGMPGMMPGMVPGMMPRPALPPGVDPVMFNTGGTLPPGTTRGTVRGPTGYIYSTSVPERSPNYNELRKRTREKVQFTPYRPFLLGPFAHFTPNSPSFYSNFVHYFISLSHSYYATCLRDEGARNRPTFFCMYLGLSDATVLQEREYKDGVYIHPPPPIYHLGQEGENVLASSLDLPSLEDCEFLHNKDETRPLCGHSEWQNCINRTEQSI